LLTLLRRLQVSVVDQRPQELFAAVVLGVRVQYAAGLGPSGDCSSLRIAVDSVQIDDEMPGTRCPSCLLSCSALRAPTTVTILNPPYASGKNHKAFTFRHPQHPLVHDTVKPLEEGVQVFALPSHDG
jgi:hypothetical protein